MKRIAIAIVLTGLLLLMMPTAVSAAGVSITGMAGDGTWDGDTWRVEMFPGESKATVLTLYNSSSSSLDVELTIVPDSFNEGNLTFELNPTDFTMPGRSYTDVTLTVKTSGSVTPSATSETYTMELAIEYEVPPTPPRPTPPAPMVTEPEEEEPVEEPIVPEPPEPTVPEPEEPTEPEEPEVVEPVEEPEEPEVIEPEEEEPEVVEPEEEEEIIVLSAKPGTPWGLIGGIVGGLAATGGIGYWLWLLWRRRRKETNHGN